MWGPLIFGAVVVLALVFVLEGSWPSERERRLRMAAEEIRAAEAERNEAEVRALLAEALLSPDQAAELQRLRAAPPVADLITNDPSNERPST